MTDTSAKKQTPVPSPPETSSENSAASDSAASDSAASDSAASDSAASDSVSKGAEPKGVKRRKLWNLFTTPRTQLRYGLDIVASGLVVLFAMFTGFMYSFSVIVKNLVRISDLGEETIVAIQQSMLWTWAVFGVFFALFSIFALFLSFVVAHRIAGPIVPLRRHIDRLKKGDYSARVKIRDKDDLQEMQNDLNELAEILEKRHGSTQDSEQKTA